MSEPDQRRYNAVVQEWSHDRFAIFAVTGPGLERNGSFALLFALRPGPKYLMVTEGPVAELVDAPDLKSVVPKGTCPFESDRGHHSRCSWWSAVLLFNLSVLALSALRADGAEATITRHA